MLAWRWVRRWPRCSGPSSTFLHFGKFEKGDAALLRPQRQGEINRQKSTLHRQPEQYARRHPEKTSLYKILAARRRAG